LAVKSKYMASVEVKLATEKTLLPSCHVTAVFPIGP